MVTTPPQTAGVTQKRREYDCGSNQNLNVKQEIEFDREL